MASLNLTKTLKFSAIAFNSLVIIGGIVMLIVGAVIQNQIGKAKLTQTLGGYSVPAGSIVCVVLGILALILGSMGFYAVLKDKYKLTYVYASLLFAICIAQIITGAIGLSAKNNAKFETYAYKTYFSIFTVNSSNIPRRDFYQQYFKCCGWNGITDYMIREGVLNIPSSCCRTILDCNVNDVRTLNDMPCSQAILPYVRQFIDVTCIILIIVGVIEFLALVLSASYARHQKTM